MQYSTTISQKGQIVVPKVIRDHLNLRASDILHISLENNTIVARPAIATSEVFGMFSVDKRITKADIKGSFKKHLDKKFIV